MVSAHAFLNFVRAKTKILIVSVAGDSCPETSVGFQPLAKVHTPIRPRSARSAVPDLT